MPLTVLVLRNDEYAILKWFGLLEGIERAPGLDLPALDTVAVAAGYDVVLSNSRGPDTLADLVAELGPRARAATPAGSRAGWSARTARAKGKVQTVLTGTKSAKVS